MTRRGGTVHAVFDTNVVLSALLFTQGHVAWLRQAWLSGSVVPLVSHETASELCRVLAYPKFQLDPAEQEELLGDYLPFAQVVSIPDVLPALPSCNDPADQKFLTLAHVAAADCLVSGDSDLLQMADQAGFRIVTPAEFKRLRPPHVESPDVIHESSAPGYRLSAR